MKKSIITSLLFLMPCVAMAADHCTNPNEYTIDKRCYVTDEQKTQKPYNAVVKFTGNEDCTGTIVKEEDGTPYLYTAEHCDPSGSAYATIKLENDNTEYGVGRHAWGEWSFHRTGDWAVYKLPEDKKEDFLKIAVEKSPKDPSLIKVVGYGALKIMSDKEISDLKQDYMKYVEENNIPEDKVGAVKDKNGNILGFDMYYTNFKNFIEKKYSSIFGDSNKLKESSCKYFSVYSKHSHGHGGVQGGAVGCQGWHGNSGGPVFDNENKIFAITVSGRDVIGGPGHAQIGMDESRSLDPGKEFTTIIMGTVRVKNIDLSQKGEN